MDATSRYVERVEVYLNGAAALYYSDSDVVAIPASRVVVETRPTTQRVIDALQTYAIANPIKVYGALGVALGAVAPKAAGLIAQLVALV